MVEQTVHPNWNQQILVHNPRHAPEADKGFFVIQLRDFHRDSAYDTLYLPMEVFKPYIPLHVTFGAAHRENPT